MVAKFICAHGVSNKSRAHNRVCWNLGKSSATAPSARHICSSRSRGLGRVCDPSPHVRNECSRPDSPILYRIRDHLVSQSRSSNPFAFAFATSCPPSRRAILVSFAFATLGPHSRKGQCPCSIKSPLPEFSSFSYPF